MHKTRTEMQKDGGMLFFFAINTGVPYAVSPLASFHLSLANCNHGWDRTATWTCHGTIRIDI